MIVSGLRDHGSPLQYVRGACGDLCDMSREHVPWNFLNYTIADVRNLYMRKLISQKCFLDRLQ